MTAEAHVSIRDVRKQFGSVVAVGGVSLDLPKGAFMALLGPSGCGKTTLLRMLAGFERPDSGSITLGGRVLEDGRTHLPPEKRRIGLVFQEYALFPHMTVEANVGFGVDGRSERKKKVQEMLELVGLSGLGRRMPHELSGGQQQRVALARTLATEPDLVLLDEPFSNLDPTLRTKIRSEVRQILENFGATAIVVTHDQEEAFSLPGLVGVMLQGRLLQVDTPLRIYQEPAHRSVAAFAGDSNFLPGERRDNRVTWLFGAFRSDGPDGPVDILVRPEDFGFDEASDITAKVVASEFFGRDQVVEVARPDGTQLRVRLLHGGDYRPGQSIGLRVTGTPRAFDRE